MKKLITIPFAILLFGLFSCEQIPDLNPNTNAGADISVFNLNDTIINNSIFNSVEYDLDEDGLTDFEITDDNFSLCGLEISGPRYYQLTVRGRVLSAINAGAAYPNIDGTITYLPKVIGSNGSSTQLLTNFDNSTVGLFWGQVFAGLFSCTTDWSTSIPTAANNKYIMIKIDINGNFHSGWIEYFSNYDKANETGQVIIKRAGVANTPGTRINAGQTE